MVIHGYFKDGMMYKIYYVYTKEAWKINDKHSYPIQNKELVKVMSPGFMDFEIIELSNDELIFSGNGACSKCANPIFPFERIK